MITSPQKAQLRDLVLPFAVVAVVGMMIFPLPSAALDALLMCNISFALALLISSVYLSRPERFTTLPSILLLCTLFRLGLNISTTRQILASGTAPDVIVTFGSFVVSGNPIVGIVVFAIITLVQFLVIAKGAERVAEVAARFTLDAMPGKQMSIDADVRCGILSLAEAKEKRLDLHRESKLFGALDGAMKFVKGDAVAGLLITVINIVAGLVVGVSQQSLSLSAAAEKYTLFTIGDGLVSQIPALLVAVAAGIAVTRVEDRDSRFVGRDMLGQLTREPQALATTGGVILALALVPGLPFLPYLAMAMLFAFGAYKVKRHSEQEQRIVEETDFRPKLFSGVVLRISAKGTLRLQEERTLPNYIQSVRAEIFEQRGVVVPDVQFDIDRERSDSSTVIYLHGEEMREVLWNGSDGTSGQEEIEPEFGKKISDTLCEFLKKHLAELVDDTQTRMLLEVHHGTAEDLINSVVPEMIGVTALTALLRELVLEEVSIRNLGTILQAIAEYNLYSGQRQVGLGQVTPIRNGMLPSLKALTTMENEIQSESIEILTAVRMAMRRTITRAVAEGDWRVRAWVLNAELDCILSRAAFAGVPLDPSILQDIIASVQGVRIKEKDRPTVIITSIYSRKALAGVLAAECDDVKVIAVAELCEEAKIEVMGEICSGEFAESLVRSGSDKGVGVDRGLVVGDVQEQSRRVAA